MNIRKPQEIWICGVNEVQKIIKNKKKAIQLFGMSVFDMTENNFLSHPVWDVFTFGTPPVAIDIMIKVDGLNFADVFEKSVFYEEDKLKIRTISRNDLITAKKNTNRSKDLNDLENLE